MEKRFHQIKYVDFFFVVNAECFSCSYDGTKGNIKTPNEEVGLNFYFAFGFSMHNLYLELMSYSQQCLIDIGTSRSSGTDEEKSIDFQDK